MVGSGAAAREAIGVEAEFAQMTRAAFPLASSAAPEAGDRMRSVEGAPDSLPIGSDFVLLRDLPRYLAEREGRIAAVIAFGQEPPPPVPAVRLAVALPQLGAAESVEVWHTKAPVAYGCQEGISFCSNDEVMIGAMSIPDVGDGGIAQLASDAYRQLLDVAMAQGFPYLSRIWNYFPAINCETGGLERYRQFCIGRHQAFAAHDYPVAGELPAATAVGTLAAGFCVYFMAGKHPGRQIENPRQVSAFLYPPQYGPKSPSFSRATLMSWSAQARHLFISGTASIVGHETAHRGDVQAQVRETLTNVDVVMEQALGHVPDPGTLGKAALFKVYLRHPEDLDVVLPALRAHLGEGPRILCLQGDLCRSDLLMEMEGVIPLPGESLTSPG